MDFISIGIKNARPDILKRLGKICASGFVVTGFGPSIFVGQITEQTGPKHDSTYYFSIFACCASFRLKKLSQAMQGPRKRIHAHFGHEYNLFGEKEHPRTMIVDVKMQELTSAMNK
jgi:hypothetical protein